MKNTVKRLHLINSEMTVALDISKSISRRPTKAELYEIIEAMAQTIEMTQPLVLTAIAEASHEEA